MSVVCSFSQELVGRGPRLSTGLLRRRSSPHVSERRRQATARLSARHSHFSAPIVSSPARTKVDLAGLVHHPRLGLDRSFSCEQFDYVENDLWRLAGMEGPANVSEHIGKLEYRDVAVIREKQTRGSAA